MNIAKWVLAVSCFLSALLVAQNGPSSGTLQQSRSTPTNAAQNDPRPASVAQQERVLDSYGKLPLTFERNHGQSDPSVKFLSRGSGYMLFLTSNEAVFALRGDKASTTKDHEQKTGSRLLRTSTATAKTQGSRNSNEHVKPDVLRMKLHGANASAKVTGEDELPGKTNYFLGNDPKRWHSSVPTYAKVKYEGVYPGVDLVYYGNQRRLEYDFIVAAGADPARIQFDVSGANTIMRDGAGDLVLSMSGGEVRWRKPVVYQEDGGKRKEIAANYVVKRNQVAFGIGAYDRGKKLFIDPLAYSTFLGGSKSDFAMGIAMDTTGNVYVVGYTQSTDFPLVNAFQSKKKSGTDAFISKINASGSALVYSTYLGGGGEDIGYGIAVDSAGNTYVAGSTKSTNFPTANPLQAANAGGMDAFLTKLDPTGASLVYSTYLGGTLDDAALGVATDSLGNTFAVGYTVSTNFPTVNALQPTNAGAKDAFLVKLDPTGSSYFYSTYLGGGDADSGAAIAIDSGGKAYVTGFTLSSNFPIANAFQPTYGGDQDAFVSVVGTLDGTLVYSTYLGGSGPDQGNGIVLDASQNAYVTGSTSSTDFPTAKAVQPNYGGNEDAFVTELNKSGSALIFSTYLGGSSTDIGYGIALDSLGDVYVTGSTSSTDFPTKVPFQGQNANQSDAFITQLSPGGAAYVYSTYLGAGGNDFGRGIAVDVSGDAFVAGYTNSGKFPLANPIQNSYGGGNDDAFVSELLPPQPAVTLDPTLLAFGNQTLNTASNSQSVSLTNSGELPLQISSIVITGTNASDFAQTNDCGTTLAAGTSCTINVTFTPSVLGSRSANVTVTDNATGSPQSMSLTGRGVLPSLMISPRSLTFLSQLVFTTSQAQEFTITNVGLGTLFISDIAVTGPFAETGGCTEIPPQNSCSFSVTFQPLNRGTLTGSITITDNAPNSPQTVSLTGTGTFIQLIPTSINFGTQPIHSTSLPHKIAVTNKGSVAVSIGSISIVGMNAGDFAQTNNCGTKLEFGATCMITVTFTPTVRGNRSANISITDNGGGSPQRVSLFGVGT